MTKITDATVAQSAEARTILRFALDSAFAFAATELRVQPLSMKTLAAKMLAEDFAAIDLNAASALYAWIVREIEADGDQGRAAAIAGRHDAHNRLAAAEMARNTPIETRRAQ